MIMWIILGVLVAAVVTFLVITSTLDRKKRKKEKAKLAVREEQAKSSVGQIAVWVNLVVKCNKVALDKFVPSIGDMKMSQINEVSKEQLKLIKKSPYFKKLSGDESVLDEFSKHIEKLIHSKSNNWLKKNIKDIDYFINKENTLPDLEKEKLNEFIAEQLTILEEQFKITWKEIKSATSEMPKVINKIDPVNNQGNIDLSTTPLNNTI